MNDATHGITVGLSERCEAVLRMARSSQLVPGCYNPEVVELGELGLIDVASPLDGGTVVSLSVDGLRGAVLLARIGLCRAVAASCVRKLRLGPRRKEREFLERRLKGARDFGDVLAMKCPWSGVEGVEDAE